MYLGLDIGRHFIKAVTLEKTKDGFKILDAGQRLVPDLNQAYDPDKIERHHLVMAVKELFRQQNINPKKIKNITTSIGGSSASVKQITTQEMPAEELESSMTFEARKHIPMDGTDAVIDYQIFGNNEREVDKINIGLVACTDRVLTNHIEVLKDCGIKPGIIDVDPIALANVFSFTKEVPDDGLVVMLDIGSTSSSLVVWGKTQQFFTRDLPIGGHDFTKEISSANNISYIEAQDLLLSKGFSAIEPKQDSEENVVVNERSVYDNLIEDIRRSLRFYAKQTGQSFFLKIFLAGGIASIPGLQELITSKLNIECSIFDPFEKLEGTGSITVDNKAQYSTAVGLAIHSGEEV